MRLSDIWDILEKEELREDLEDESALIYGAFDKSEEVILEELLALGGRLSSVTIPREGYSPVHMTFLRSIEDLPKECPPNNGNGPATIYFVLNEVLGVGGNAIVVHATECIPYTTRDVSLRVRLPHSEPIDSRDFTARHFGLDSDIIQTTAYPFPLDDMEVDIYTFRPGCTLDRLRSYQTPIQYKTINENGVGRYHLSLARKLIQRVMMLHEKKLVHGDLKPENIIITPDGEPFIIDIQSVRPHGSKLTSFTLEFLAPEADEDLKSTFHTDQFALGMSLLYALDADVPYGLGPDEVLIVLSTHIVCSKNKEDKAAYSRLAKAISRMIQPDPSERFSSLQDAYDFLNQ